MRDDPISAETAPRRPSRWRRWAPVAVLALALAAFWALGVQDALSWEALRAQRADLIAWRDARPMLSAVAFVSVGAALMAIGFPSVAVIMAAGGLIFGLWAGAAYSLGATTAGSFVLFLAVRHARAGLAGRLGAALDRVETHARGRAFLYLLSMRLTPIFPTLAVTLTAAAARIGVRDFLGATLLGLAPGALVYAGLGAGAGVLIEAGAEGDLASLVFRPIVLLPLLGLAGLAFAAARLRRRKSVDG